ncbi:hypothetical protein COY25_02630 [Candidatus Uhrbacteria bacterium CG_4_10_14_0_2_um_filter_41_7]|uniref:Phosphatidic acid phosphatase type 2/haloperoxidase domain-containing protein n=1 Tax=Candidatus Uhrbacteria bacterium CG_4_9_14_3_um_filter_41_35 TaxID=1975034 RepID=A0A2M7XFJ4_9BACT|nr:MAG: hypothetical protein COY25_02630 [Candidatus Uhrbacteria bacterium CG_4_10_14_0_2_um_filter_41_7]PJA46631.1 MAG: hypothetical protein CO173_02585 [Candidatus Uhrbacteria bacterium CG_4_9_14_3_um_filter_41_35]
MYNLDLEMSKRIHSFGKKHFAFWSFLSRFGFWFLTAYAIILLYQLRNLELFYDLIISVIVSFFGVLILRWIIKRPRPEVIKTSYKAMLKWSFPSLHASVGFAFATSLALLLIKLSHGNSLTWLVASIILVFTSIIVVTRLFVGVHYLSDLLAGGVIGILIAVIAEYL